MGNGRRLKHVQIDSIKGALDVEWVWGVERFAPAFTMAVIDTREVDGGQLLFSVFLQCTPYTQISVPTKKAIAHFRRLSSINAFLGDLPYSLTMVAAVYTTKDSPDPKKTAQEVQLPEYETVLSAHIAAWEAFWEHAEATIEGDDTVETALNRGSISIILEIGPSRFDRWRRGMGWFGVYWRHAPRGGRRCLHNDASERFPGFESRSRKYCAHSPAARPLETGQAANMVSWTKACH